MDHQLPVDFINTVLIFSVPLHRSQFTLDSLRREWNQLIWQYTIPVESVRHFLCLCKKWCFVLLQELTVTSLTPSGPILSLILSLGCLLAHWPQQICFVFESLLFDRLYHTTKYSKLAMTHYFLWVCCVSPTRFLPWARNLVTIILFHSKCLVSSEESSEFLPEVF